jgi:hypothetical protein
MPSQARPIHPKLFHVEQFGRATRFPSRRPKSRPCNVEITNANPFTRSANPEEAEAFVPLNHPARKKSPSQIGLNYISAQRRSRL